MWDFEGLTSCLSRHLEQEGSRIRKEKYLLINNKQWTGPIPRVDRWEKWQGPLLIKETAPSFRSAKDSHSKSFTSFLSFQSVKADRMREKTSARMIEIFSFSSSSSSSSSRETARPLSAAFLFWGNSSFRLAALVLRVEIIGQPYLWFLCFF